MNAIDTESNAERRNEVLRMEYWEASLFAGLCKGEYVAISPTGNADIFDKITEAIEAGDLPADIDSSPGAMVYGPNRKLKPALAALWAESKFPAFPDDIKQELLEAAKAAQEQRAAQNRYTLYEAAKAIASANALKPGEVLALIIKAAATGTLSTYQPGKELRMTSEHSQYAEAYTLDLRTWMQNNEGRLESPFSPCMEDESKSVSRAQAQDDEILAMLVTKGHDPKKLPQNPKGKPGVKAEIREALGKKGMWGGRTVFDKAWERLTKNNDIVIVK